MLPLAFNNIYVHYFLKRLVISKTARQVPNSTHRIVILLLDRNHVSCFKILDLLQGIYCNIFFPSATKFASFYFHPQRFVAEITQLQAPSLYSLRVYVLVKNNIS